MEMSPVLPHLMMCLYRETTNRICTLILPQQDERKTERGDVFVHFSGNSVLACVGNLEGVALQNVFSNKLINKNL